MKASGSNKNLHSIKGRDAVTSLEALSKLESMSFGNRSRTRLSNNLTSQNNIQFQSTRPYMNQTAMYSSIGKNLN